MPPEHPPCPVSSARPGPSPAQCLPSALLRPQATPDRFLSLARIFHTHLFTGGRPEGSGAAPSPAQRAVRLATLLLLEMLDLDRPVGALAEGRPVSEDSYVFAAADVRDRVNAELRSWWPSASAAHSPVLLAWAAVLCLMDRSGGGGGGNGWEGHAAKAHEADALGTLHALTVHTGLAPTAAEMFDNVVLRWAWHSEREAALAAALVPVLTALRIPFVGLWLRAPPLLAVDHSPLLRMPTLPVQRHVSSLLCLRFLARSAASAADRHGEAARPGHGSPARPAACLPSPFTAAFCACL